MFSKGKECHMGVSTMRFSSLGDGEVNSIQVSEFRTVDNDFPYLRLQSGRPDDQLPDLRHCISLFPTNS